MKLNNHDSSLAVTKPAYAMTSAGGRCLWSVTTASGHATFTVYYVQTLAFL